MNMEVRTFFIDKKQQNHKKTTLYLFQSINNRSNFIFMPAANIFKSKNNTFIKLLSCNIDKSKHNFTCMYLQI